MLFCPMCSKMEYVVLTPHPSGVRHLLSHKPNATELSSPSGLRQGSKLTLYILKTVHRSLREKERTSSAAISILLNANNFLPKSLREAPRW